MSSDVIIEGRSYPAGIKGACWVNAKMAAGVGGHRVAVGILWMRIPGTDLWDGTPHSWAVNPEGQVVDTSPLDLGQEYRYREVPGIGRNDVVPVTSTHDLDTP